MTTIDWNNGKERRETSGGESTWEIPFSFAPQDVVKIKLYNADYVSYTLSGSGSTVISGFIEGENADGTVSRWNNFTINWNVNSGHSSAWIAKNGLAIPVVKIFTEIIIQRADANIYQYTDADVKVNSEIRFTLDETNGKLAGQFGLKKTIDKEAGKLTFTADTLPTSAISGTLEIGETSTEGAAFVEGITSDSTGFVKATEENTFTAKQTFQDVQINGNLTAKGTTTTVDVKNLDVEQQLITVAKGNTVALTSPAGLKAEKYDGTKDGALVFDASGTAMVGDVVLDANGNIDEAQSDLQDLATRAKPSELTDGHLLKWDATNKKIVDGGAIPSVPATSVNPRFYRGNAVKYAGVGVFASTAGVTVEKDIIHIPSMTFNGANSTALSIGYAIDWPYEIETGTSYTAYDVIGSKDGSYQPIDTVQVSYSVSTTQQDGETLVELSAHVVDTEVSTAVYKLSFNIYLKRKDATA